MKELVIHDLPVTVQIDTTTGEFIPCLEKVARRVSDLAMMFSNQEIVQKIISMGDKLVYEIRYYPFMESRDGDYHSVTWKAGTITHIPPQYAHRVINTGSTNLVFVASFHVSAGHEYDLIEARGFKNIIIEQDGKVVEVPNPRRRD